MSSTFAMLVMLLVGLFIVNECNGEAVLTQMLGKCLTESNCASDEYCDRDFPNPIGECKKGAAEGRYCFRDKHCASKRCSLFRCKPRIQKRNGPCKVNADCPDNQFCKKLENDLRQCYNRKCIGSCFRDQECLSNRCHIFVCIKKQDVDCLALND